MTDKSRAIAKGRCEGLHPTARARLIYTEKGKRKKSRRKRKKRAEKKEKENTRKILGK